MITELTPEQTAKFPEYVKKWLDIGLSTEPTDFEKAKVFIKMAYEATGELTPPETFYLVNSPKECIELDSKLSGLSPRECLENMCYGNQDAAWLSFYDYFMRECNVEECSKLNGLFGLSECCGWWSPRETYAIVCHRPTEIHMDEQNRLHNESGMAVKYVDGYGIWAINGITVTEQIVMHPETLTVKQIDGEQNMDVRSIMLDRFTWVRYIKDSKASCLDKRTNDVENTMEALYQTKEDNRLVVTCPTGRMFSLGVPGTIKTCAEAQRWLGHDKKLNVIART